MAEPRTAGAPVLLAAQRPAPAIPLLVALAYTAVADSLIAAFLNLVNPEHGFLLQFAYSQAIGLASCLLVVPVLNSRLRGTPRLALIAAGIAAGTLCGIAIAWLVLGWPGPDSARGTHTVQAIVTGLFFGVAVSTLFALRQRATQAERQLAEEALRVVTAEKAAVEMELRMLQAQIEPHFLFNTLANVASLIDASPGEARRLLEETIRYLRATLARARALTGSLGQELAIVEAYLEILRIRMGARLDWLIDVAEPLRALTCPPLLLQPLVENAVKHGIEPSIDGGQIRIAARLDADMLVVTVADTGRGLSESHGSSGVGLANVRERLAALHGDRAGLSICANAPRGTLAQVRYPAHTSPS